MEQYDLLIVPQILQIENDTRLRIDNLRDDYFKSYYFEDYKKTTIENLDTLSEEHLLFLIYTIYGFRGIEHVNQSVRFLFFRNKEERRLVYIDKLREFLKGKACSECKTIFHSISGCPYWSDC